VTEEHILSLRKCNSGPNGIRDCNLPHRKPTRYQQN